MDKKLKDLQFYKFCAYGFLKNLRFFEPFLILFFLEKDLNYLQIGTVYTVREITRNLFEIPAGVLADVLGRRRTMMTSFTLYIVSFVLFYLSQGLLLIIIATLFFALGDAFRTGTHKAMIFDYLSRKGWSGEKTHYYGHTRSWSQLGSAVSSLLAAALVFLSGKYNHIFLYTAVPYVAGVILIASYPSWLDGERASIKGERITRRFGRVLNDFWRSFRSRLVLKGIFIVASYSGYYRAIKDYLQPVIAAFALSIPLFTGLEENKRTGLMVGLIYFVVYLLSSRTSRQAGNFAGRFKQLSVPLNVSLVTGLTLGILAGVAYLQEWYWLTIILFVGIYLVENLRMPVGVSWFSETVNEHILATALSTESQGKTIFTAFIALLLGFLADRFDPGMAFVGASLVVLLVTPLFLLRNK